MKTFAFAFFVAAAAATTASAQTSDRCKIVDPTGTPLNLRATPGGAVIGTIANGQIINYVKDEDDARGRTWVLISRRAGSTAMGWVYREFIACY